MEDRICRLLGDDGAVVIVVCSFWVLLFDRVMRQPEPRGIDCPRGLSTVRLDAGIPASSISDRLYQVQPLSLPCH